MFVYILKRDSYGEYFQNMRLVEGSIFLVIESICLLSLNCMEKAMFLPHVAFDKIVVLWMKVIPSNVAIVYPKTYVLLIIFCKLELNLRIHNILYQKKKVYQIAELV